MERRGECKIDGKEIKERKKNCGVRRDEGE
jgi:hypothetical protein